MTVQEPAVQVVRWAADNISYGHGFRVAFDTFDTGFSARFNLPPPFCPHAPPAQQVLKHH